MRFVLISRGDGYVAHTNVDPDSMNLPDEAEIYDNREEFEDRLSDFE